MLPDEKNVTVISTSNFFPARYGITPRYVILHGTAGGSSAEAIARYFVSTQGTPSAVSSHYIIGRDGEIVQCVAEKDGAWANGLLTAGHDSWWDTSVNPNNLTITIEHCKPTADNSDTLTPEQQASSFRLIKNICARWNIPMRAANAQGGITGHFSLDPVNRSRCPGPYPWDQLWAFLKGGKKVLDFNDPIVRQYFTDAGNGQWRCKKNGVILKGRIREFYAENAGPALFGLPNTNEIYPQQYSGTAVVVFERCIIVYDPGRKIDNPPISGNCYLLHINSGLGAELLKQVNDDQIKQLTNRLKQIHDLSIIN